MYTVFTSPRGNLPKNKTQIRQQWNNWAAPGQNQNCADIACVVCVCVMCGVCVCVVCVCVMCVSVCKYGMGDCVLLFSDLTQCTCTVYCVHMRGVWAWAYCKDYMNETSAMPSGVLKRIICVYQISESLHYSFT